MESPSPVATLDFEGADQSIKSQLEVGALQEPDFLASEDDLSEISDEDLKIIADVQATHNKGLPHIGNKFASAIMADQPQGTQPGAATLCEHFDPPGNTPNACTYHAEALPRCDIEMQILHQERIFFAHNGGDSFDIYYKLSWKLSMQMVVGRLNMEN